MDFRLTWDSLNSLIGVLAIALLTAIIKANSHSTKLDEFVGSNTKMIAIVVTINILIALFNFYLAWRIWKIRRSIAGATKAILAAERNTYQVLHTAPDKVILGQKGSKLLREKYRKLEFQVEKLGKLLGILNFSQQFWLKRTRQSRQLKKVKKQLAKY